MKQERENFLEHSTSPDELHEFALRFNWDDGCGAMFKIIQNEHCALNTARLIFWLAQGDPFDQYATRQDVPSHHEEAWDLVQIIIEKAESDEFSSVGMPTDYRVEVWAPSDDAKWSIDPSLYGEGKPWD